MAVKKAPQADKLSKPVTPLIQSFVGYIKEQTGYVCDPMSVQLGATLRGEFQKSEANQRRIAEASERRATERAARHERFLAKLSKQGAPTINSGLKLDGTSTTKPTPRTRPSAPKAAK